jgi:[ribosomal protein S18]-alanine N-acetyltransferase
MDDSARSTSILHMKAKHLEDIAQLEKLCFSAPWSFDALAEELSNPLAVFLVAESNKAVCGYVGMHHITDEGYITNIAVFPQYRRKGIASMLLKALDEYAQKNDLSFITLEVRQSNEAAINLYESFNYKNAGERRGFYEDPNEDAAIMTKKY